MKYRTLKDFVAAVNDLSRHDADEMNAKGRRLFGAFHHDLSESMLGRYYSSGYTPRRTLDSLADDAASEALAEARCS